MIWSGCEQDHKHALASVGIAQRTCEECADHACRLKNGQRGRGQPEACTQFIAHENREIGCDGDGQKDLGEDDPGDGRKDTLGLGHHSFERALSFAAWPRGHGV